MNRQSGSALWLGAVVAYVLASVLTSAPASRAQPTPGFQAHVGQGQGDVGTDCHFTYETYSWDLTALTLPYGSAYWSSDSQHYSYALNVCGNVLCRDGLQGGVCQTRSGSLVPYHIVGYYMGPPPTNTSAYWDLISASNPGAGLVFVMFNGDECSSPTRPRRANLYLDCDPAATTYSQNFTIAASTTDSCVYDIHFKTNRTCLPGYIPPTVLSSTGVAPVSSTGAVASSTGGKRSSSSTGVGPVVLSSSTGVAPSNSTGDGELVHLSGGSWFLVSVAGVSFAYVLFGCIYRRVAYGVVGCDGCPNYPFWSRLPGYVADGFRFVWAKVRCRVNPNIAYDAMK